MSAAAGGSGPRSAGSSRARPPDVFVARQPIFDPEKRVYGYELLFRSGAGNVLSEPNPDQASAKVISDGAFLFDPWAISCGRLSFVSVTREILLNEYVRVLPRGSVAAQIPQSLAADRQAVEACARLKEAGYALVLDGFTGPEQSGPLLKMADIVKVNYPAASPLKLADILSSLREAGVRLLAANVETHEHFARGVEMGCSYLQGDFLSKPELLSARDVPGYKVNYLRMLKEIQSPNLDAHRMEEVIKHDTALAFKLLRYINSAYFGLTGNVTSILHAIMLLGPREFKRWASLLLMAGMGADKPDELVVEGLIRARFCESLAPRFKIPKESEKLFLVGMFSLLDAVLDRPLGAILKDLPLMGEIEQALLGAQGPLRTVLDYAVAYQKGDWGNARRVAGVAGLDDSDIPPLYEGAVRWAEQNFEEVRAAG